MSGVMLARALHMISMGGKLWYFNEGLKSSGGNEPCHPKVAQSPNS